MNQKNNSKLKVLGLCAFVALVAWVAFWMGTTLAHRTRIQCEIAKTQHNIKTLEDLLSAGVTMDGMLLYIDTMKNADADMLAQLKAQNQTPLLLDLLKAPAAAPVREHILFYSCKP